MRNLSIYKKIVFCLLFSSFFMLLIGCSTTPYTGRSQVMFYDFQDAVELGNSSEQELLMQAKKSIVTNKTSKELVEIGNKLVSSLESDPGFKWNFYLINSKDVNAFALPNGAIFFYTGILDLMDSQDEIAAVMGHEIAHVIAMHSMEKMSESATANILTSAVVASVGIGTDISSSSLGIFDNLSGKALELMLLKFSRSQEYEADEIGLYIMADAGFDPKAATTFWEKMGSDSNAVEFLSTHPLDANRLAKLNELMPAALTRYSKDNK